MLLHLVLRLFCFLLQSELYLMLRSSEELSSISILVVMARYSS